MKTQKLWEKYRPKSRADVIGQEKVKKQIDILLVENGAEIVTGLNIMKAITVHPASEAVFIEIMESLCKKNKSPAYLVNCLWEAKNWIDEINQQVKEPTE